jgi:hypothetical protein
VPADVLEPATRGATKDQPAFAEADAPSALKARIDTFGLIAKVSKKDLTSALDSALLIPREFEGLPTDVVDTASPRLCTTVIDTRPARIDLRVWEGEDNCRVREHTAASDSRISCCETNA